MADQYFNPNMGSINQYTETNQSHQIPSPLNFHVSLMMGYEYDHQLHDNLFPHHLSETSETYHPGLVIQEDNSTITPSFTEPVIFSDHSDRKRKSMEENSSANSSSQGSDTTRRKSGGRGKKVKVEEEKKGTDHVLHVRAKRGQATDSHSLAERVRRGKINERLRCLQDIVPGCYKTMGMAGMLDEIINYVQSLQNQVEFLSMKLAAASTFYDFNNLDTDAIQTMQREKAFDEALKIQNLETSGLPAQFALQDLNLCYFPQLPHNR